MKDHIFETLSQIIFLLVFTIFAILVSLGISQDFSVLATTEFWVQIASQLVLTMTIFNIVHGMDLRNRMHNEDSRFFKSFATFRLRVKEIDTQKLYDKLDVAVEEKNKERLIKKCNDKLHRLCTRVNYEDVITQDPVDYLINKFKVFEKREKKFKKLVEKIRTGRIRVVPVKAEVFLQDKEVILEQWSWLREVAKIPGSYIIEREISNIWNSVVFNDENLRSTVSDSIIKQNKEIGRKMQEFGYMDEQGNPIKSYIYPTAKTVQAWKDGRA